MSKSVLSAALSALWLLSSPFVVAQAQESTDAAAQLREFNASLQYQRGDVPVAAAHATLHLDGGFRFLPPADSRRVLEQLWGNPPDDSVLGMLVPDGLEVTDERSWAVVLTYSDDGYVSDEEAAFGGAEQHTVNYDIRALGRGGYLSLNAVGGMGDLASIQQGMGRVLNMVEFDAGHRYADFNDDTDKVAGYGLAALVGGVAAGKMGLFAKLGVLLLGLKKFAVFLVVGAAALLKRLFGKKDGNSA